jgi:hypothetical protein
MTDVVCVYPWRGLAIRPNKSVIPCCRYPAIHLTQEKEITTDCRNTTGWQDLRQDMLDGKKISGCQACYDEEKSGVKSMRQISTPKNFTPSSSSSEPLELLEVAFSNLCNLACVSCNSDFSTKWAAYNHKHSRPNNSITLIEHDNLEGIDLSKVKWLKIIGGEPFMDQNRFIDLMEKLDLPNVKLFVSTNGTILPNSKLKSLIDKCRHAVIEISIDGYGLVNEWYRWPTKQEELELNMRQYLEWQIINPNITIRSHTVINIYNVWNLNDFFIYMNNKFPEIIMTFDWIRYPNWQSLGIIPDHLKIDLKEKLQFWSKTIKGNCHEQYQNRDPFLISIDRLDSEQSSIYGSDSVNRYLEKFKQQSLELAEQRGLDLLDMIPDLKPLFLEKKRQ